MGDKAKAGALIGGTIGFVVGGPVGAAMGASIGGAIGGGFDIYEGQQEAKEAAKESKRQARQARIDAMRDRKVSSKAGTAPRNIIYGQTRTGGQIVLEETSGTDNEYMHVIIVFAAHSCEEIGDVYIDEDLLASWNGSSHTLQPDFIDNTQLSVQLGNQAEALQLAVDQIPSWTTNHKLLGQAYIYLRFKYDRDAWDSRRMNISAVIKGKNDIYDPRTGLSGWTDNQALCALDYLRWSRGRNVADSVIDMQSFADAADVADQLVTKGGGQTEKRYTVNGVQAFGVSPNEVLAGLALAGAMTISRSGQWFAMPGVYDDTGAPSFNEDDLVGGIDFSPRADKKNIINIAKGTYIDPAQNYEAVDFVHVNVAQYITDDQEEFAQNYDFPFTDSSTRARRLAKIFMEKARYGLVVNVTLKFKGVQLSAGDRIKLTVNDLGWVDRVFRVERLSINLGKGVDLALKEDAAAVWDWQEGDALAVTAPPALNVPDPRFTPAPTDITVSEELYAGAEAGSVRVRAMLDWLAGGVSSRTYDVQFKLQSATTWNNAASDLPVESMNIDDLEPALYDFRVRGRNGIGVYSEWSQTSYQVLGKTAPPEIVTGLAYQQRKDTIYVSWNDVSDLDIDYYELRTDENFGNSNGMLYQGKQRFTEISLSSAAFTLYVRAVDTSGNRSIQSASLAYGPPVPSDVPFISANQTSAGVSVSWGAVTDVDFANYEIRTNTNFGSADGLVYKGIRNFFDAGLVGAQATYYAKAISTSGIYSANAVSFAFTPTAPQRVNTLSADSIDSTVLLKWSESQSIYPISNYRIYRGDVFQTAAFVGESSGTFEVIVENESGTYRYWVEPVDTAGVHGEPRSVVVAVDNPPDYILRRDSYTDLSLYDRSSVGLGQGGGGLSWNDLQLRWDDVDARWDDEPSPDLIGPINQTETFPQNMARSGVGASANRWDDLSLSWDDTSLPWDNSGISTYQDKLDAGYTHWLQPATASGFAEEIIDLGALIPSTRITVAVLEEAIAGQANATLTISTSQDAQAWTVFELDQHVVSAANFQYIRLRFDLTGTGGLALIRQVRVKLDVKQITDQGTAAVLASDTLGTEIVMNRPFLDIDSVIATPRAVDAKIAVTEYDDVGNQDRFRVYVFDRATGARVDATVNWIVRGS